MSVKNYCLSAILYLGFFLAPISFGSPESDTSRLRMSLVRILVTAQIPDYRMPWNPGRISRSAGSGFIISGSRIMTNAHVVSNARYITIDKDGDPRKYTAQVKFIAHDCDLAILEVDNPDFFKDTHPLSFGEIPDLHSTVTVYGYPIGGERMSVTRGVVSRIEFRTYSHSGLDAHLTIQIDAAINPGNSGGPVIQNNKVVGVAFQGYSGNVAQNTGYMIPTPVIGRFLEDIKDDTYDGYVELGVIYLNLLNPGYRQYLELPDDNVGVVVTNALKAGASGDVIKPGDVLLNIDKHPITSDGHIELDGEYVQMEEVVERKFHGDIVSFDLIRDGKPKQVEVSLKGAWPYAILANRYDKKPEFIVFSGLLFQPVTRNLLSAYKNTNLDINYFYGHFITDEIYQDHPQIIILSAILPDPINAYSHDLVNGIVDEINGVKIKTLSDMAEAFDRKSDHYVIRMIGKGKPIVIDSNHIESARQRITERYSVITERFIEKD